jgi:hypothetical protein
MAQSTASAGDTVYMDDPFIPNLMEVENWISSSVKNKKIGYCYKPQVPRPPGSSVATDNCPPGDYVIGGLGLGLCYTPCPTGYIDEPGVACYEPCPPGYTDAGICWKSDSTSYYAPTKLADCPDGYINSVVLACHRLYSSFSAPSRLADCPSGYTNMGLTCYVPWSVPIDDFPLSDDRAVCPSGYFKGVAGRCYSNCAAYPGYTNIGEFCAREARSVSHESEGVSCPAGYYQGTTPYTAAICWPNCKNQYHNLSELCVTDRLTYPRASFSNPGHGHLCPEGFIRDQFDPVGLCYKACPSGYYGEVLSCYQNCPNGWVSCGVGCAKDGLTCVSETFGQVFSVLVVAANIVSLGLATTVTSSGSLVATTIKIGSKTFSSTTRWGGRFIKVIKGLQSYQQFSPEGVLQQVTVIKRMKNKLAPWTLPPPPPGTNQAGLIAAITDANRSYQAKCRYKKYKNYRTVVEDLKDLRSVVSEDFATITSQEINDIINANYDPVEADFIKQYYSSKMLAELQATSEFEIAKDALSTVALMDPTGIAALVDAFTHPLCGDLNLNFPAKPKIIYGSGVPNAGVGVDGNYYVNTDANLPEEANTMYGPKKNGVWPQWTPNY